MIGSSKGARAQFDGDERQDIQHENNRLPSQWVETQLGLSVRSPSGLLTSVLGSECDARSS